MSNNDTSQLSLSGKVPILTGSPLAARKKKQFNRGGKRHQFRHSDSDTDSENSDDDFSITSSLAAHAGVPVLKKELLETKSTASKSRKRRKARQDWEIVEGLKDGQTCDEKPGNYQSYMMKKRRWPLKGWHKRFFFLEKGKLFYAKAPGDIQKGKFHGVIDIALSVIAFKRHRHRIDIDAEDIVYHVKVKENRAFEEWIQRLKHHRLYRQHVIAYGTKESPKLTDITSPTEDIGFSTDKGREHKLSADVIRQSSFKKDSQQSRVATWVMDSAGFEHCDKGLNETQTILCELRDDLEQLRNIPLTPDSVIEMQKSHIWNSCNIEKKKERIAGTPNGLRHRDSQKGAGFGNCFTLLEAESEPNDSKKKSRGLGLRSKRKEKKLSDTSLTDSDLMRTSSSNPNLVHYEISRARPSSMSDAHYTSGNDSFLSQDTYINDSKLRETFVIKAEKVHKNLKSLLNIIGTERDRLKQAVVANNNWSGSSASLNKHLIEALRQNAELRNKLAKIHAESALRFYTKLVPPSSPILSPVLNLDKDHDHVLSQSLSTESCSISEYYDAEEFRESASESSSEQSDEDEISSEENDTDYTAVHSVSEDQLSDSFETGRRSKLPVPKPDTGDISLWNLLYKNIGKDLSKISMPITLNEPLSMLQRLCEELEYNELIEKAVGLEDPYERMIHVAAFAVSSYASTGYRAGHKPFNPLLGETYECDRPDKGWRFVAEQVSHHPPISACYCDSKNFIFWQETRIKTRFWGKSMEIQPVGIVNLVLPKWNEQYKWNKVTTCVHNLLGGQRWVDHYGEVNITCGDITCKLTFKKASSWSSKRHEIHGHINNPEGKVVHHLSGKWNEALYCGSHHGGHHHQATSKLVWRPGAMPDDFELYYGFTRFAIELNELDPDDSKTLPPTDTRFRHDQRLLEEGKIHDAENEKTRLEHMQRERRKKRETEGLDYSPMWFKKTGKESYEYLGKYWECKKSPGFNKMSFVKLW
ncbi:OSBPL3_6_7 [Mytilus coruscus]|uniref:Oxysterol-binding protein n=1 Tax=Mytilus coruscus TaxID=42192 RepID=A0A6J8E806_MYTCO|nr:OSBPL3_6_7 [Mytilus coruscus]